MDTVTSVGLDSAKSLVVIGVLFAYAGQDRARFIREWISGTNHFEPIASSIQIEPPNGNNLVKVKLGYGLGLRSPDYDLLEISMGCGGHAIYHRGENIPLVDVPCPCENSNHWLIKWTVPENLGS